jgi:hypothetical protein
VKEEANNTSERMQKQEHFTLTPLKRSAIWVGAELEEGKHFKLRQLI